MDNFNFPIVKKINANNIADDIIPCIPATLEELAKGRKIVQYPMKFDDFDNYDALKNYLLMQFEKNEKAKPEWLKVSTCSSLPLQLSKKYYYIGGMHLQISCNKPKDHILDDIVMCYINLSLNPTKWSISKIENIFKEIK